MASSKLSALEELEDTEQAIQRKRDDALEKFDDWFAELASIRHDLDAGRSEEDGRVRVRSLRRRALGAEDIKRQGQLKAQDVRVRMRVPENVMPAPPQVKRNEPGALKGPSKVVLQGTIQRELQNLEARLVSLVVAEDADRGAGEMCLLVDLRAGLLSLTREMPEHELLLTLVSDHLDQVQAVMRDLAAGGAARARRFLDHDRELLGRYRAMQKAEGASKPNPAVDKLNEMLSRLKKTMNDTAPERSQDFEKMQRELESALVTIHRELSGAGFVAAKSVLFSALSARGA